MTNAISSTIHDLMGLAGHVQRFFIDSEWARRKDDPGISDFVAGNPQEMPLPEFGKALAKWSEPQNKDWYAYTLSMPTAQKAIAAGLSDRFGMAFEPDDIVMTTGAFGAIAASLRTLLDPGDEVIFLSPPWFLYEAMIAATGATPVRVKLSPPRFDLDLAPIAAAMTHKTRAIILNSPNNPSGRVYPDGDVTKLAALLASASEEQGRPVYLLSDEAYSRILYDDVEFMTPTNFYANSLLMYTYGKTLLTPGQRIGYIALPPELPNKEELVGGLTISLITAGWAVPNALMQYAVPDLEKMSIDIGRLQARRDRMVPALREMGYELESPDGTFYLLPKSPIPDEMEFVNMLAEQDVFVLPGAMVELPGYFRISLTANDDMVERSLPGFEIAMQKAKAQA